MRQSTGPILLPQPRQITLTRGTAPLSATLLPSVRIDPRAVKQTQGYRLEVTAGGAAGGGATIVAHDEAGAFYGRATLAQLQRQGEARGRVPCLRIDDHPDFLKRGIMLDISRDKVPTMATLHRLVDMMAGLKLNELQLYTEHTFAYARHREVWASASPITPDEIRQLDAYCRARHIELVPNQNSFGHMERWLKHRAYKPLAETTGPIMTPWGRRGGATCLCAVDPRSVKFLDGLFAELLPCFTSEQFNVGCDETWDLGQGRSKAACERKGKGRVYLDFLLKIHKLATARGKRVQFWGDIILHHPELIAQLPSDVTPLAWGYEADHPFEAECARFADAGLSFYVCPGTSSWNSLGGRTTNALANLQAAARHGLAAGARGYLITDWGDNGHLQPLPVSFLGYACGAAASWSVEANNNLDLVTAVDQLIFDQDADQGAPGGAMAKAWSDLGDAYRITGIELRNKNVFWTLLNDPASDVISGVKARASLQRWRAARKAVTDAVALGQTARLRRDDGELIKAELTFAGTMMTLACDIAIERLKQPGAALHNIARPARTRLAAMVDDLIDQHRHQWLARNRQGGMADSAERLRQCGRAIKP